MITKEYRIPMPLDPEEYRIAQLYMIAKKSKIESTGQGSGVEIVTNEPYSDGPGGNGQYTDKLYHIDSHLPYWFRGFLPKSLAVIREEAWNAYPYSMNKVYMPNMSKFSLDIESKYIAGGTKQENVFQLSESELGERIVDVVDFVKDDLTGNDYQADEDATKFKSEKTGRGPLDQNWLEAYERPNAEVKDGQSFMCVYKICRVRFDQWPLQGKVEQFVQDYVRKTLVRAHRQAWTWQDEWHGLTIEQIRGVEKEIQESLAKLMRND